MKRYILQFLLFSIALLSLHCGKMTPDKYFGIAVLNVNMLFGFADDGFSRQLESPSSKLAKDGVSTEAMSRSELINQKNEFIEENFEKVEDLKVTDDTKDMISASVDLYKFVLPVLKNDYTKLAEMYDKGVSEEEIETFTNSIRDRYHQRYSELYNNLVRAGKEYADKNGIKVNWGVYGK